MTKVIFAAIAALLISGCAALKPAADKIAVGVNAYCTEPLANRQLLREDVNAAIAPNSIKVHCNGDPE